MPLKRPRPEPSVLNASSVLSGYDGMRILRFLAEMKAAGARLSLHLSKCHIVGNHMSQLNIILY